jgi:hypothetical protein
MRGTRASYNIKKNEKFSDTSPEKALDSICEKLGLALIKGEEIQVPGFTISPDRKIAGTNVLLEADGIYHDTKIQRRKSSWRDDALVASGYRVLHIESELLVCHGLSDSDRFWPYVSVEIKKFIDSSEPTKYLRA